MGFVARRERYTAEPNPLAPRSCWVFDGGNRRMHLTPDQEYLKARAAALSNDLVQARAAEIDRTREYPWDVVDILKVEGLLGMTIPEILGGQGRSFLDTGPGR